MPTNASPALTRFGHFDRRALLGGVLCTAAATGLDLSSGASAAPAPGPGYSLQTIADGIHFVGDGAYNTMFLVTKTGVVACDAPPTLGANYLRAIREVTDLPVTHLVYSHEHIDHIGGASLFPKGTTIVGCRRTADLLKARNDPRRPVPTVVFDDTYRLEVGGKVLELSWKGVSHSLDTVFIHAPAEKVLMVVDVVYPGWMPYKNLGVAVDTPGYVKAHYDILAYDFQTLVAGHVDRPGTRADVELAIAFLKDLLATAERAAAVLPFPAYLKTPGPGTTWERHGDYEQAVIERMVADLRPRWLSRLKGVDSYLRDNCWAMFETLAVQGAPTFG